MEIDLAQPVTKGDLKFALDALDGEITTKIAARIADGEALLRAEIAETRRTLAVEIVKTQAEVREIKETMATKRDIDRIMDSIDKYAGKGQDYDRASVLHGEAITEMRVELKDHERRIKQLEN